MAIRSVFAFSVLFLFTCCDAKAENCSEARCKLLPLSKRFASEFRSKAVKKGVRMIYLQLKIGKDSYNPLQAPNDFLPYRWVWAPKISELLLSLSYDYDILSLGLLKRQVRGMDVKLEDEPSGCLAGLNSSCQDIVVARTLLGNVTARNGSVGVHSSKDVVCVAEIDKNMNFFENFLESNVKFRCCKVVDDQGGLNLIPECDLRVQNSNWYKAFYVVLNFLTLFVGLYSPALLFVLPDYIFDLRKECEKEHQQEEEERSKQNVYLPILSSQETREESINVTDANAMASEGMMPSRVRRQATLAEDNANVIEEPDTNELNVNDATENEANLKGPNSNEPNLNKPNSDVSPNSSTNDKGKDEEEERKLDEIPVDDGSPVNISTLLYACASAKVFRHYSTKLSFNIKLAFLWFCVIPFLFYIELALSYILKDEYLEEIGKKDAVILTGGLYFIFDMTQTGNWVLFSFSFFIIPLLIILILRPKDLSEERTRESISLVDREKIERKLVSYRVFIGDEVLQRLKDAKQLLLDILSLGKVPIHVYQAIQNSCDHCKKTGARRSVRLFWVLLTLISSICAVICSIITAAICLLLISFFSTLVVVLWSPYFMIQRYFGYKLIRRCKLTDLIMILALIVGLVMLFFSQGEPILYALSPLILLLFTISGPFYLSFSSSRFIIRMCGYTIMGLIYNAEIAAPIAVFFATLASYLDNRYFASQTKCMRVKEIISQEWHQGIKYSLETGKLNEEEKPKVVSDAFPKKLFWYVCDGVKYQVFPLESEALRLLRDVAVIFFTAFLALCAIFFSTNSYKISTVASIIAVFVSAKIPMVLLRGNDNFNGWEKIKTKRIIRESVGTFIEQKKWLQPGD